MIEKQPEHLIAAQGIIRLEIRTDEDCTEKWLQGEWGSYEIWGWTPAGEKILLIEGCHDLGPDFVENN